MSTLPLFRTLGEVPSEATFSRAFDAIARDGRPQQIHEAMIKTPHGEKLTFSPAEARRYNERSSVERVNSHFHLQNPSGRPPQAGDARGFARGS